MSRDNNIDPMTAFDWVLIATFFIVTAVIYWGMVATNDIIIGFVVPIGVMAVVLYLGVIYIFEQRRMLKTIAEEQEK